MRIYEKVVEEIKKDIATGALKPGDPLPPERKLMSTMGISRSSLKEAFRVLELMGFIESVPCKGRFVRYPGGVSSQSANMPLADAAILELMEARRLLDPAIAALAARHSTHPDMARIRKATPAASKILRSIDDVKARAQMDFDFHLAMAEATHNFVFINITRMNFNLIMATHERIYEMLTNKDAFLEEHAAMYEAMSSHDEAQASHLAASHIDRIYKSLKNAMAIE